MGKPKPSHDGRRTSRMERNKGDEHFKNKDYKNALKCYDEAKKYAYDISGFAIYYNSAETNIMLGDLKNALEDLNQCENVLGGKKDKIYKIEEVPIDNIRSLIYQKKLYCLIRLGEFKAAREVFKNTWNPRFEDNNILVLKSEFFRLQSLIENVKKHLYLEEYTIADGFCEILGAMGYKGPEFFLFKSECIWELHGRSAVLQFILEHTNEIEELVIKLDDFEDDLFIALCKLLLAKDRSKVLKMETKINAITLKSSRIRNFLQTTRLIFDINDKAKNFYADSRSSDFGVKMNAYLQYIKIYEDGQIFEEAYHYRLLRATEFMKKSDWANAIKELDAAMKVNDNHLRALRMRMQCYDSKNDWSRCFSDAKIIYQLTNDPEDMRKLENAKAKMENHFESRKTHGIHIRVNITAKDNTAIRKLLAAFKTLGVQPFLSQSEANKAYKKISLACHPDKNQLADRGIFVEAHDARKTIIDCSDYNRLKAIWSANQDKFN